MLAASERSRSVRRVPPASSTSPVRKSTPAGRMCRPGIAASVMATSPSAGTVSSWMTTASAPCGMTPPGKNPHRLAGADVAFERPAGGDLADYREPRAGMRGVDRAHRIAVHRRHRLRRLGAQGRDVAREHAVVGRIECGRFLRQRLGARKNRRQCLVNRHQRQGGTPKPRLLNPSAAIARAMSSDDLTPMAIKPLSCAPSIFSARSSKNTIREAGTPIAFTT